MMGHAQRRTPKLFYAGLNIDERMPEDHPLRRIARTIDFDSVRAEVGHLYGQRGNPSVDPAVLLKLMFLLYHEDIHSERKLMEQLPLRLDWLWFCGYDLDDETPNHSVISKARRRWGTEAFESFFEQILMQCVEAGLVDGQVVHVDASVITANADRDRLKPALRLAGRNLYQRLEDTAGPQDATDQDSQAVPENELLSKTPVSPTDPDARLTRVCGESVLGYRDHRVVDDRAGIITASLTTDAATADASMLEQLLDEHEEHVGHETATVVADKTYGTAQNYKMIHDRGAKPCIPHARRNHPEGKFPHEAFRYDAQRDCFICPAGQVLTKRCRNDDRHRDRYRAPRTVCRSCRLKGQCTGSDRGRTVGRHLLQEYIDWADGCFCRQARRRLMLRRKIRAEGSFADAANNHGYKRARWRGLMKVRIQNLLIATIQNLRKLLKAALHGTAKAAYGVVLPLRAAFVRAILPCRRSFVAVPELQAAF